MANNHSRFRLTAWPGEALPIPRVARYEVAVVADDFLGFGARVGGDEPVPDELYLRELFDLDELDPTAVAEFSRAFGRLGRGDRSDLPGRSERAARSLQKKAGSVADEAGLDGEDVVHVEEAARYVEAVRALTLMWDAHTRSDSAGLFAAWADQPLFAVPPDEPTAWVKFESHINDALSPFQVRVSAVGPDRDDRDAFFGIRRPNLFNVLCLQLTNHIAEGAIYRRCANERCDRLFNKQQGTAVYGQHRTKGVKYCSRSCAIAQGSREHRRRKKAEQEER